MAIHEQKLISDLEEALRSYRRAVASGPSDNTVRILCKVHGALWSEAYYDATNDSIREFAKPLADLMSELNKELKFKR